MNVAVIPAGGQGRRMANRTGNTVKQFLLLGGIPIIIHTLRQFELCPDIDAIIVVLPEAEVKAGILPQLRTKYNLNKLLPPVIGGAERQASVFCGLQAIANSNYLHTRTEIVAIHDAVRPFISTELISLSIQTARQYGGAVCAIPATDTIKEVENGQVVRTIPRTQVYQAQTPQTFRYAAILDAHRKAAEQGINATDDAALIEWLGGTVRVVAGSPHNIKITKPSDIGLAEMILNKKEF